VPTPFLAKWDGHVLRPVSKSADLAKLPVDGFVSCTAWMRRSPKHHRRTFGIIRIAFASWPEAHTYQPKDDVELRYWLTMKAGYYGKKEFTLLEYSIQAALVLAAQIADERSKHPYSIADTRDNRAIVWYPETWAWDKMDQTEFAPFAQEIENVICVETGLTSADLDRIWQESQKATAAAKAAKMTEPVE